VPALGQRLFWDEVVVALLLFRETRRAGHLRDARGTRALNLSHRRVQPRLGKVEVRGTAQRLLDERIELRIPVGTPPSIPRPRRSRSCEGVRAAELLRLFHGRRRVHAGELRAARGREEAASEHDLDDPPAGSGKWALRRLHGSASKTRTVRYSLLDTNHLSRKTVLNGLVPI